MSEISQDIQKYIDEFTSNFFKDGFSWRRGQREAVSQIVEAYFDPKYDTVILDAPTGSGKSLIAIASSWVLNRFGKVGFILASDISLQDQYEESLFQFDLNWGNIKGLNNYVCEDNDEKVSLGTCKIRRKKPQDMDCYSACPYYAERGRAILSSTSVLNYAYWLTVSNGAQSQSDFVNLFPKRDFAFCDEAHKILDIVQNLYSLRISKEGLDRIERLTHFFDVHKISSIKSSYDLIEKIFKKIEAEENQNSLMALLNSLHKILHNFSEPQELLIKQIPHKGSKEIPKEWRKALWDSDWLSEFKLRIGEFIGAIENTSIRNLIKNPQPNGEIAFHCLEEKYLMHKYFHRHTGFRVLMSATFSNPGEYLKNIALSNAKYIKMDSSFDFDESPIYFYTGRKMSYKNVDQHLPWIIQKVEKILESHQNESGLIHSASYDLARKIYLGVSEKNRGRILVYNGTEEKNFFVDSVKNNKNKVIMGPSLLEGLDFKDDFGRFQIFPKIPYLSLGDKFIKIKSEMNPTWYQYKAALALCQGIGRIVRNENDWGITYILDGSLSNLIHYNRNLFDSSFYSRLKIIKEEY